MALAEEGAEASRHSSVYLEKGEEPGKRNSLVTARLDVGLIMKSVGSHRRTLPWLGLR